MNLTFDEVSWLGHIGWGYLLVTLPVLKFHAPLHIMAPIVIAAAGKEYWDCHGLETEAVSGGVKGSWIDFATWCIGIWLGVLVSL
jgi:hypothetical protein